MLRDGGHVLWIFTKIGEGRKEDKQGKVENKELESGKNWKGARSRLEEATGGCGKNEKVRIIEKAHSYNERTVLHEKETLERGLLNPDMNAWLERGVIQRVGKFFLKEERRRNEMRRKRD